MRYLLLLLLLMGLPVACSVAHAEVLVRQCDAPIGTTCSKFIWVKPPNAITVNVLRLGIGTPWVKLSEVLPTERIATCYNDPAVAIGSSSTCSTRVPGRTDVWELKSILYPPIAPTGPFALSWGAVTLDTTKAPMTVGGYVVSSRPDYCAGSTGDPRCGSEPNWTETDVGNVTSTRFEGLVGAWCFIVQAYSATKDRGAVSDTVCGTALTKQIPDKVVGLKVVAEPAQ